jgi:hypothetical protein
MILVKYVIFKHERITNENNSNTINILTEMFQRYYHVFCIDTVCYDSIRLLILYVLILTKLGQFVETLFISKNMKYFNSLNINNSTCSQLIN